MECTVANLKQVNSVVSDHETLPYLLYQMLCGVKVLVPPAHRILTLHFVTRTRLNIESLFDIYLPAV